MENHAADRPLPPEMTVLSRFQAEPLLDARRQGLPAVTASLDLGYSTRRVELTAAGIAWGPGQTLGWEPLAAIAASENGCFRVREGEIEELKGYCEETRHPYRLLPTAEAPVLLLAGFTMHRFKDVAPTWAAREMVRALGPLRGRVLDTATGLGYTAIAAAGQGVEVETIELDPGSVEMARANPWSQELFSSPRIHRLTGDCAEWIATCPAGRFTGIVHDPPSMSLAGDLYGGAFYRELARVLEPRGRLFHYIGDPVSGLGGRVTEGVVRRLKEAGFRQVRAQPRAFGVLAMK